MNSVKTFLKLPDPLVYDNTRRGEFPKIGARRSPEQEFLYLCTVMDTFSRKIVGWTLGDNVRAEMVLEALERAYVNRNAGEYVIVHPDRGVQYASTLVRDFFEFKKAIRSMSRMGNCWDNSMMDLFLVVSK